MRVNPILNTDSYKYSHYLQYPPRTQYVTSYIEARGSYDPDYNETVFFGLQAFLMEYMMQPITMFDVMEANFIVSAHGEPFNLEGWKKIVNKHGGFLPVKIEAVPEGTAVPLRNVLVQVTNTDPELPWVTTFVETAILRAVWYPSTVATISMKIRNMLKEYAAKSGSVEGVDFKLHDFGARGVSSNESAMLGGLAHLATGAMGTDTVMSLVGALNYYDQPDAGFSIPAAEHSTITSWGPDHEIDAYRNMLQQFAKPGSLVAVVSDSYNIWNAVDNLWGEELKKDVINSGATVVVRPDSGDPTTVPVEVIERLMLKYGYTVNEKGYKTLPKCIRVIQGDGINKDSIKQILANMDDKKLSLDNIAFGMGGALLQKMDRDTFMWAMKESNIVVDGKSRDVFKSPVGDAVKASKRGRLKLVRNPQNNMFTTMKESVVHFAGDVSVMRDVYEDGVLYNKTTLKEVRATANAS